MSELAGSGDQMISLASQPKISMGLVNCWLSNSLCLYHNNAHVVELL